MSTESVGNQMMFDCRYEVLPLRDHSETPDSQDFQSATRDFLSDRTIFGSVEISPSRV